MFDNVRVTLDKFWRLFGYLRKVVGNLRKMAALTREILFLLLEHKIQISSRHRVIFSLCISCNLKSEEQDRKYVNSYCFLQQIISVVSPFCRGFIDFFSTSVVLPDGEAASSKEWVKKFMGN